MDHITRKMTAAFRKSTVPDSFWMGIHICMCGAHSDCQDHILPSGDETNSLCIHYVAHHRQEVPPEAIRRIARFKSGEAEPSPQELQGPDYTLDEMRSSVEAGLGSSGLKLWSTWGLNVELFCRLLHGGSMPDTDLGRQARQCAKGLQKVLACVGHYTRPGHLMRVGGAIAGIFVADPDQTEKPEHYSTAFEPFQRAVGERWPDPRAWGERALHLPQWEEEPWLEPLLQVLRCDSVSASDRRWVVGTLHELGPSVAGKAVRSLAAMWNTLDAEMRWDVYIGLSSIGELETVILPPEARDSLVELARQPGAEACVRCAAARLLGRSGLDIQAAVDVLLYYALYEPQAFRLAAKVMCTRYREDDSDRFERGILGWQKAAMPKLLEAAKSGNKAVRERAQKLLELATTEGP